MDIFLEHIMGNLSGDNYYSFSRIPGYGMSAEPLASKVEPSPDSAGRSQVVIIYAFHEAPADYDRFTPFFAETLKKGLDAKKEIIFVQEDIGASLSELRVHHDEFRKPDILSNPQYREMLRKYWYSYRVAAQERIMSVIRDKADTCYYPTEFASLLMSNAREGRITLDFEDISFETWLKWESGMVAFEDNILMLSCGQVDAETFIARARESIDVIKQGDIERDVGFSQQLSSLIGNDCRRLVITHRGIGHYGMHEILRRQGVHPVIFSIAEPKDFPSIIKLTFERTTGRSYSESETILVMKVVFSAMLAPAVQVTIDDTLECHRIADAIAERITKEEFLQLFQYIADAKSPGHIVPNLCSWLKQNDKLGEQEKHLVSVNL